MVSGISSSGSDTMQLLMQQMMQKMKSADTDGTSGLSKSELSSIDAGDDVGGANFLSILGDNFDKIDADANGQLSDEEISAVKPPPPPMGPPPGMQIENLFSSADTDSSGGISLDELGVTETGEDTVTASNSTLSEFFDKLDTNKDGEISLEELKEAFSKPPEGEENEVAEKSSDSNSENSTSSDSDNLMDKLSEYLLKQLTKAYQSAESSGALSKLTSALDLAV